MDLVLIGAGIFIAAIIIIELLRFAYRNMHSTKRAQIRKRLRRYNYVEGGRDGMEIFKRRIYSDIPWLNAVIKRVPFFVRLDNLIVQANAEYPIGFYFLLSLFLGVVGYLVVVSATRNVPYAVLVAGTGFMLPYASLSRKKSLRIEKFKKQLPDALDLIARSLKAGQSFNGGLSVAAEEMPDPIGPELAETLGEINYGVSVADALKNLAARIDCEELRFFIIGVILQRETGGNLAELMETLASLIRERFQFSGKVQTLSAEGRLSMWILMALPIGLGVYLYITNPGFIDPLFTEPIGRLMVLFAGIGMIVGGIVMHRMVNIKV